MQQAELAAAQHLLSAYLLPYFSVEIVYNCGQEQSLPSFFCAKARLPHTFEADISPRLPLFLQQTLCPFFVYLKLKVS
jgi:hypothetical protein